jgi:hypothetical protein
MNFTIISVSLTDESGNAYAVELNKEAKNWEDKSPSGRSISSMNQSGNANSSNAGIECSDGGISVLILRRANWSMAVGANGGADHQRDSIDSIETDWSWNVDAINTRTV